MLSTQEFIRQSNNPFAFPGGYTLCFITQDSGVLCHHCAKAEQKIILESIVNKDNPQWEVINSEINYEDTDLYCDHCYERIPPEYAD